MTLVKRRDPFPYRVRDGRVEEIELDIDMPVGIEAGRAARAQPVIAMRGSRETG